MVQNKSSINFTLIHICIDVDELLVPFLETGVLLVMTA